MTKRCPGRPTAFTWEAAHPELYGKELSRKRFHAGQRPGAPGPGDALHRRMRRIPVSEAGACGCGRHLLAHVRCASRGRDSGRLSRFGYGIMTAMGDSVLGPVGTNVPAHEFHHWDSPENGDCFSFKKPVGTRERLWNGKPLRRILPVFEPLFPEYRPVNPALGLFIQLNIHNFCF